jgi:DNA polymerase elongation subunit (family B)
MALEFQIYDYEEDHESDDTNTKYKLGDYIIHVFGRTIDDKSVYVKVIGFAPYFYINVPNKWTSEIDIKVKVFEQWLKSKENSIIWNIYKNHLINLELVEFKESEGFKYDPIKKDELKFKFIKLTFKNYDGMRKYVKLFENNEINIHGLLSKYKFNIFESNLPPKLRCFHIRKISGCSWVSIENYKKFKIKKSKKESYCNIEVVVDWEQLMPIKKEYNAPLTIASYDIECYSHDNQFPQAYRKQDKIIQIGVTYTKLGQSKPYRKWIVCLDKTDPIQNCEVCSVTTESDLISAWIIEIIKQDCDIITGYNIFGFDEKYIYDRCDKILNMKYEVSMISKLKNYECKFKEVKLASSALGENLLKFIETPGRVHIDLMKDVQKTEKLPSYKLDYVASNYIRGEIKKYEKLDNNLFVFTCLNVDDIEIADYLHIEIMKGFVSDDVGDKYLINDVDRINKKITVFGDNILDAELEIFSKNSSSNKIIWSQAKDDVEPAKIFEYQMKGSKERSIVAKYCLKDCSLINLLINKLEIVTKNIEMANVCFIPLNYLFIRGQGIKLFSLCLKEFMEQGYIFPVIKVKKNENGEIENEESYEGAIVFDPVPRIDYEANSTKDYASLYPSADMQKNMSHETILQYRNKLTNELEYDSTYDNIPGITYYNASYNETDGTTKYIRFAKNGNKLGVIPSILKNLLGERKIIKKQMKTEKDQFKYKILDAKQLAVKMTANSLYGSLGAPTSAVANRTIAACITSTGREMLLFAKKYDEELLPWIFNGIVEGYKNNIYSAEEIINMELKNKDEKFINKLKNYCKDTINNYTLQPVIRYGDSVASYTPIYIKVNNNIYILTIEELANKYNWIEYDEKEYCELNDIETWSDHGWTKLHRIIRHKLLPEKKMIRVLTNTGLVDVTDDHSLLLISGEEISPKNVKIGINLLHNELVELHDKCIYDRNIYFHKFSSMIEAAKYTNYLNSKGIKYKLYCDNINLKNNIIVSLIESYEQHMIKELTEIEYKGYVYDLTTDNHHFAAGVGNMIVHNTDSVFACFRFKDKKEELSKNDSLELFNKIINFGKELLEPFFLPKDKLLFIKYYDKYYGKIDDLILPKYPDCIDLPDDIKIVQLPQYRIKQLLKEYLYENYLPWLWTLQEIINCSFENIEIKLFDWSNYILKKYKFTYNNLKDNRKDEVINPIIEKIESFYKKNDNEIIWKESTSFQIADLVNLIENIFIGEITKSKTELNKLIKEFLQIKLKQEWTKAVSVHDSNATKEKKKLKREHTYNNKNLSELLEIFIVDRLKLNFNKYKNDHINKLKNFISDHLKEYIIYPWWDIINGNKIYKIKIYNKSEPIIDKRTLDFSIELGELSGELVKSRLPFPHDLEYEKTFWPFMILTKKRYVGNKYEFDNNKFKQDFMGIVLKRRDNAPIVKEICSGIIDQLINKRNTYEAKKFVNTCLTDMFENKYDIKYFLQSRTLKAKESYKDWTKIAHVFLADKVSKREGSQYESGNRIEFAVVVVDNPDNKKLLQGEIIETTSYIKEKNIPINYLFYMKNQIMNPVLQFLNVVDKNAEQIFLKFEEIYSKPKIKKIRAKSVKSIITENDLSLKKIIKKKNIDTDTSESEEKNIKNKKTAIKKPNLKELKEELNLELKEELNLNLTDKLKIKKKKIVLENKDIIL